MTHKEASLEERMTAIEITIKYQSEQIQEIKSIVEEIRDQLAERREVNGVQTTAISQLSGRVDKLEEKVARISYFVWLGVGAAVTLTTILQIFF